MFATQLRPPFSDNQPRDAVAAFRQRMYQYYEAFQQARSSQELRLDETA
jgi:hypothetical protein